jgi:large subunit ribosomal protein L15
VPADLSLSTLQPAKRRTARKRVGRGLGSGKGRYSGRGVKGQKARSGSHRMRPGFEGGQNPIYMRLGKQRGPYSKDAMPIGPHRTSTQPVNVRELERVFDDGAEVTLEALVARGVIKNTRTDVKILGNGDVTKRLTVTAHSFSRSAREKIEAAGGAAIGLREPKARTDGGEPPETGVVGPAEPQAPAEAVEDAGQKPGRKRRRKPAGEE